MSQQIPESEGGTPFIYAETKQQQQQRSGETGGGEPRVSVFVLSDSVRAELGNFCNSIAQIDDSTTALWRLASVSSLMS